MFLVSQAFVDDTECRNCTDARPEMIKSARMLETLWNKSRNGSLKRMSPDECLAAYGTLIQSSWRSLLVVTKNDPSYPELTEEVLEDLSPGINNTNLYQISGFGAPTSLGLWQQPLGWICSGLPKDNSEVRSLPCINRLGEIKPASQPWVLSSGCIDGADRCSEQWSRLIPHQWPVDYCLSDPAPSRCQLHFNLAIAVVVTVLNFVKAALMFYVAYSTKESPLMTMGDAVASFIDEKDDTTNKMGMLSIHDHKKGYSPGARAWNDRHWRWKDATSKKRRATTLILYSPCSSPAIELADAYLDLVWSWEL
jgi:hypothetical protein